MLARDVMSRDVVTVGLNATLLEAVKLLINTGVSGLPVLDESGALAGMLSEFDVIRHVVGSDDAALSRFRSQMRIRGVLATAYSHALSGPVRSIMVTPVVSAADDADLEVVATLMLEHRVKRIPIVTGASVVGIVSQVDLMKVLLSRPADEASAAAEAPSTEPGPLSDDQLRRQVATAVRRAGLAVGGGFDVVTRNGVAHLWGRVTDEASHQACRTAAGKVPGVRDVFSHMQVVPSHESDFDARQRRGLSMSSLS